jgi:hypothetical protein
MLDLKRRVGGGGLLLAARTMAAAGGGAQRAEFASRCGVGRQACLARNDPATEFATHTRA